MAIRFDEIQLTGSGTNGLYPTLSNVSGQKVTIQSSHGYIRLGSDNSSYGHIETDRASFYFNKAVSFDGSIAAYGGDETASFASYIDSQDTNYFVNPNGSSSLYTPVTMSTNDTTLTFQDAGTNAFQIKTSAGDELYLGSNNTYQLQMTTSGHVNTQGDWRFGANFIKVGNSSTYNSDDGSWGSRFVVSSTVHARIDCAQDANAVRASWFTHTGQLYSTFGTVTGHDMRLISHNATRQTLYNGYSQESGSYRAPKFYTSGNTTYYSDPANTSVLNIVTGSVTSSGDGQSNYPFRLGADYSAYMMAAAGNTWGLFWAGNSGARYGTNGNGGPGNIWSNSGNPNEFAFVGSDSTAWTVHGSSGNVWLKGYGTAADSYRAPIFYDSAATTYYVDPGATTSLRTVGAWHANSHTWSGEQVGKIQYHSDYWYMQTTNGVFVRNASGANNVTLLANGVCTAANDWRAPQFYDSADTSYILNLNGTSHVRKIRGVRTNLATSEGWAETNAWNAGTQTGFFGGNFTINGDTNENNICYIEAPSPNGGSQSARRVLAWKCSYNGSGSGADGGWNKTITGVDYNKAHISVVYVKRVADGNGNFYHGTTTCLNMDGSTNGNPYFIAMGSQSLPLNVWCVSIGYLHANNDTEITASHSFSGIYNLTTGERIIGSTDYRMAASTTSQHRAFLYYASSTATEVHMCNPGFYEVNGNEPNINELLMRSEDRVDSIRSDVDLRSPIYYDSNNTAYYLNPADTSTSLSTAGKLYVQGSHGSARIQLNYQHSATDAANSGALTGWVSEPGITYNGAGIGGNIHVSGQYYGRAYNSGYGSYVRFNKDNGHVEHWSTTGTPGNTGGQGTKQWYNDASGNSFATTSSRAPLFYDSNDTTYYTDPAGTSNQRNISIKQGSSFNQYRSGDGAFVYRDARAEGSVAATYKGTYTGSAYGSYCEYWYDSDSYHKISCVNNGFSFDSPVSVTGQITASADVVAYSDERLKKDIKTLDGSKVYDMRGVSFTKDDKKGSGVIAQELEKIAPELVSDNNEYKAVAYGNITGYLIEAIKDLKAEIEELKKQIK